MRHRKHVLLAVITALICGAALAVPIPTTSMPNAQDRLAVNVTVNGRTLHLPVSAPTDRNITFAIMPLSNGIALKVVPTMQGDRITFDAHLVSESLSQARTCRERFQLQGELLGSFSIRRGETVTVNRNEGAISFAAVDRLPDPRDQMRGASVSTIGRGNAFAPASASSMQSGGCECGRCVRTGNDPVLVCCPSRGGCLECGSCGNVCCLPAPGFEEGNN
jgi:hypothetical protein